MKKSILMKIKLAIVLMITAYISGCSIDSKLNVSPNAITDDAVQSKDGVYGLIVALQVASGDYYSGDHSRVLSVWDWQICAPPGIGRPQPVQYNNYVQTSNGAPNDSWLQAYKTIRIANDIIAFTPNVSNFGTKNTQIQNTILGMSRTYKALILGELAALYGSIPVTINGLTAPKFVNQKQAYDTVQAILNQAIVNFSDCASLSRDLNFSGDGAKWTKVCHSLKARYYLHTKDYTNALAEAKLGLKDQDPAWNAIYGSGATEHSPWGYWINDDGAVLRPQKFFVDLFKAEAGDTRKTEYFTPVGTNFFGFDLRNAANKDTNETNFNYTVTMKKYGAYDAPFPLISYQENLMIIAECSSRAGDDATALANVNILRKEAGLTDFAGAGVALLTEVMKQKYMQLYLEGQAYFDMRRLGTFPDPSIPKRWVYPESELNANPNVPPDNDNLIMF